MPPDADKLRQNHVGSVVTKDTSDTATISTTSLKGTEVVIDGVIYDISNFDHPGGDQIKLFGGNDVTVQYKMIHPHHVSPKILEIKLQKVGTLSTDYEYDFGTPFEKEIKQEIFQLVKRGQEFATWGFWFRLCCYLTLYSTLMYRWVFVDGGNNLLLAIVFGASQALMGLNVQHDANHGAISKQYPILNDMFGLFADFIGYSKWLWIEHHWTHHAFTNLQSKDPDATAGEPAMIFYNYSPTDKRRTWMHKFQAWFVMPLFGLYWLSTVFNIGQVLHLDHEGTKGAGMNFTSDFVVSRRKYATLIRVIYHVLHVLIPVLNFGFTPKTLGHIFIMGVAGSLTLAVPFSLSHNFVGAERNPVSDGEKKCWFTAQVETSCTYGGCVAGWLTGGLNFQIEHHLFPRMSSAWYPYIAPTVRKVCAKHGVKYTYYPTILNNLVSTLKYMHRVGNNQTDVVSKKTK